jgi:hypothetical protein
MRRVFIGLMGGLILAWYAFWLTVPINLVTADIGRHVKNGELLVHDWLGTGQSVLTSNLYSYTAPDWPVVNHHWASGIFFYWLREAGGFRVVHIIFIVISLLALALFWDIARRSAGWLSALVVGVALVPLIAARVEVRPEALSYLFLGLFVWLLWRVREKQLSPRWLWLLPLIQVAWVNTHIYFVFGVFAVGVFWVEQVVNAIFSRNPSSPPLVQPSLKLRPAGRGEDPTLPRPAKPEGRSGDKGDSGGLSWILLTTIAASLLNPFGWWGVVYPFTIFSNYGYQIVENKSIWFLENWGQVNPHFLVVKVLSVLLVVGTIAQAWRRRSVDTALVLLSATFVVLAWLAIRNFALAGLVVLPLMAYYLALVPWRALLDQTEKYQRQAMIFLALLMTGAATYFYYFDDISLQRQRLGLGLLPEAAGAADFIRAQHITGPIFNNYDIGGYLIYHFSPKEKVFVDNRPEAYPAEFFTDVYIPMQEKDAVWQKQLATYNFNAIVFYRHDLTPWAQKFLTTRVQDADWVPVYVDALTIILVRDIERNAAVINNHAIPRQVFGVRPN